MQPPNHTLATPLADSAERSKAIDPNLSCVVQAPAGSGKTTLLVNRFIKLLAIIDEPEQVVAITHTRKAANEMYQRICDILSADSEQLAPSLAEIVAEVRIRAEQNNMDIALLCTRLRVTTIDSLCQRLARSGSYHQLNFAESVLHQQPSELYRKAVRQLLGGLWQTPKTNKSQQSKTHANLLIAWQHYGCDAAALEDALVSLLKQREQWLTFFSPLTFSTDDHISMYQACWQQLARSQLKELNAEVDSQFVLQWKSLAQMVLDWSQLTGKEIKKADAISHIAKANGEPDTNWWRMFTIWILTDKGTIYTQGRYLGFPAEKDIAIGQHKQLKQDKQLACEYLNAIINNQQFTSLIAVPLVEPQLPHQQSKVVIAITNLAVAVTSELMVLFAREKSIDFIQVALNAVQALEEITEQSEYAASESSHNPIGIKHLLVDEFQDTSPVQWQLIELITKGWGRDNSLFVVGDPMQSIYGFRQAQVSLFMRAKQQGIGSIKLENVTLSSNFRSQPELVEWVNSVGEKVFGNSFGQVSFVAAIAAADLPQEPITIMRSCDPDLRDWQLVKLLQQQPKGTSIGLLVQRKSLAKPLMKLLDNHAIGYTAFDMVTLGEKQHLIDLTNLVRLCLQPLTWRYWLGVLRSPQVAASLETCTRIYEDMQTNSLTPEQAISEWVEQDVNAQQAPRIRWLCQRIKPILSLSGYRSLTQLARSLHSALGFDRLLGESELEECAQLLVKLEESASSQAGGWWIDWESINNWLQDNFATITTTASHNTNIEIMTCHKAKGLEFDLVVLPYADKPFSRSPGLKPPLKYQAELINNSQRLLIAASANRLASEQHPNYDYLEWLEKNREDNERRRLLYVALTRAKKRLVIFGDLNTKGDNFFCWLKNAGCAPKEYTITPPELAATPVPKQLVLRKQLTNFADFVKRLPEVPQAVVTGDNNPKLPDNSAMYLGSCLHSVMEQLHQLVKDDKTDIAKLIKSRRKHWLSQLGWSGIARAQLPIMTEKFTKALDGMATDSRVAWMLRPHQHKQCEWQLTEVINSNRRVGYINRVIDLSFVVDGERWIIDYKSMQCGKGESYDELMVRARNTYSEQLENYARLVKELKQEQFPIRLGIYLLLQHRWVEWKFANSAG